MISLTVQFADDVHAQIIRTHINKKLIDLINWHTTIIKPSFFLPYGFSDKESEEVIFLLKDTIQSKESFELNDWRMQFALSCILEQEERVTSIGQELSADFSDSDRRELEKYMPEEIIRYYENYDHFRDLIIPDSSYLDMAMEYNF